ncbi:MarR family transcriptional regulator [Arthrobacter sp. LjRoot14]|uniref:MarR family transcriptional regulator n=1 Tax=Arthrobacter sp. LjRoot14 TaxID=3342265 RepID=UPI003ECCF6D3
MGTVTGFIEGRFKNHTFVTGGFGTGKSRAVGTAALAAAASGSRVARLEQGPLGISSFDDFLAAVDVAVSVSDGQPAVDGNVQPPGDANERSPLVIVVEGLDQLVRQIRAADRPAFSELLVAPDGPLVVGTAILGVLPDEFAPSFEVLQTSPVGTVGEGVQIAVERALQHRVLAPSIGPELLRMSRQVELAFLGNQLFWALTGPHLAAGDQNPLVRAEGDLRALMKAHYSALLLRVAPSEQRVLLEIARGGAPRTVQEIAEAVEVRNQAAASAIARLHADGWVMNITAPAGADRRRSWYDIADPLLRVHLRPQGWGSVSDLIRSVVDSWETPVTVEVASPGVEDLAPGDAEAVRRGESGEPEVARAWFHEALLRRAEAEGLRGRSTLETYRALAVWMGNTGERQRAQRMMTAAIRDLDDLIGATSREAIESRMHAALNLVEQGEFPEARQHYAKALELAIRSNETDLTVQARLELARALGEEGYIQQAVQHIAAAVEDLQRAEANRAAQKELWAQLCRARRVQAYWLARGGDASQGAAILEELLDDPRMGEGERCRTELDRIGLVALVDRPRAVSEYQRVALEIEASGVDTKLSAAARSAAFDIAVEEWPGEPEMWPVHAMDRQNLEAAVVRLVEAEQLDLQGLAKVLAQVSGVQAQVLATKLVAVPRQLPRGQRAALARTFVPFLQRTSEQRLLSDLASALENEPVAVANLPEEWRHVVAGMRDLDVDSVT